MLLNDMVIFCPTVYSKQIVEGKLKDKSREKKISRIDYDDPFHTRSDGHGRLRYRQKFPSQGFLKSSMFNQETVSNPKKTI